MTIPDTTSSHEVITSGNFHTGTVNCDSYRYYKISVPDPCTDIRVYLNTTSHSDSSSAEVAIGKYPNFYPTFDNLEFTSYEYSPQNFTISAYDPSFDGGSNCGPNKNSVCELYIGVFGYCPDPSVKSLSFELTVTLAPTDNALNQLFDQQYVGANGQRSYQFCEPKSAANIYAILSTNRDACGCPYNYTNLQMSISRTNVDATLNDRVWRLDDSVSAHTVNLLASDPFARPGSYYLNVYGQCTEDSECDERCTCAPCSHLAAPYGLFVTDSASPAAKNNGSQYDTCATNPALSSKQLPHYTCESLDSCPTEESDAKKLSGGAVAGIVIAFFLIVGLLFAFFYFAFWSTSRPKYDGEPINMTVEMHDKSYAKAYDNDA